MIMTTVTLLVVFFASMYYITKPLFSQDFIDNEFEETEEVDRETVFLTLNELEFDYKTGKLSTEDYENLSNKYKLLAADLLKNEENALIGQSSDNDINDETEKEIEAFIALSKMEKK